MFKGTWILILSFWMGNLIYSQDYSFTWQMNPSPGPLTYSIRIVHHNSKGKIYLKEGYSGNYKIKKIEREDCDSLIKFINNYDFRDQGSNIIEGPKYREYIDIQWMPDSNRVILQNDTIRRDLLELQYMYDKDLKKFYDQTQMKKIFSDGTNYYGEYVTPGEKISYNNYCMKLTEKDYQLNKLIYDFMVKYFKISRYEDPGYIIENDKPIIINLK